MARWSIITEQFKEDVQHSTACDFGGSYTTSMVVVLFWSASGTVYIFVCSYFVLIKKNHCFKYTAVFFLNFFTVQMLKRILTLQQLLIMRNVAFGSGEDVPGASTLKFFL